MYFFQTFENFDRDSEFATIKELADINKSQGVVTIAVEKVEITKSRNVDNEKEHNNEGNESEEGGLKTSFKNMRNSFRRLVKPIVVKRKQSVDVKLNNHQVTSNIAENTEQKVLTETEEDITEVANILKTVEVLMEERNGNAGDEDESQLRDDRLEQSASNKPWKNIFRSSR